MEFYCAFSSCCSLFIATYVLYGKLPPVVDQYCQLLYLLSLTKEQPSMWKVLFMYTTANHEHPP